MNLIPRTVAPRTPLTVTELETLAAFMDSATQHIARARNANGTYAWDQGRELTEMFNDVYAGFYQLRDNTAAMVCGDDMPWNTPEGNVLVSAA